MAKKKLIEQLDDILKKKKPKQSSDEKITIVPPTIKVATITLVGSSPLLVNKFSEKAKNEIKEKHEKKAKQQKLARDPEAEFEASVYRTEDGHCGMPTSGIKQAAVSACRFIDGLAMTKAKGSFHVLDDGSGLTKILDPKTNKPAKPVMDSRFVRVGPFGKRVPMERYRARFNDWKVVIQVRFSENNISLEQIANLYANAGFSVGLCEWRPEKSGSFGMFSVE